MQTCERQQHKNHHDTIFKPRVINNSAPAVPHFTPDPLPNSCPAQVASHEIYEPEIVTARLTFLKPRLITQHHEEKYSSHVLNHERNKCQQRRHYRQQDSPNCRTLPAIRPRPYCRRPLRRRPPSCCTSTQIRRLQMGVCGGCCRLVLHHGFGLYDPYPQDLGLFRVGHFAIVRIHSSPFCSESSLTYYIVSSGWPSSAPLARCTSTRTPRVTQVSPA